MTGWLITGLLYLVIAKIKRSFAHMLIGVFCLVIYGVLS